ncbi:MAG: hypothetical protein AB1505_15420 [Candidatus Latescibacterota bacterium]
MASGAETSVSAVRIAGQRVVLGDWSGDLDEVVARSVELRAMLRDYRYAEARALLRARPAGEQAVLVAMDENPEEVLSLTGMDASGRPGYCPAVVGLLPTDVITELVKPRGGKLLTFNAEVLRAMPPEALQRAMSETLDPVYFPANRTAVAWEWLEAVAAMDDPAKAAELLRAADQEFLEDAVMDKLRDLDLGAIGQWASTEVAGATRLELFAAGLCDGPPGEYVEDEEVADVLDALHEANPELMAGVIAGAARRMWGLL